jgi:hypothetical protein
MSIVSQSASNFGKKSNRDKKKNAERIISQSTREKHGSSEKRRENGRVDRQEEVLIGFVMHDISCKTVYFPLHETIRKSGQRLLLLKRV